MQLVARIWRTPPVPCHFK